MAATAADERTQRECLKREVSSHGWDLEAHEKLRIEWKQAIKSEGNYFHECVSFQRNRRRRKSHEYEKC